MSTSTCVFAVHHANSVEQADLAESTRALGVFLDLAHTEMLTLPAAAVTVGRLGREPSPIKPPLQWGDPCPGGEITHEQILDADDRRLRELAGVGSLGCIVAWTQDRVRLVSVSSGLTGLYTAEGPIGRAWATHATAAALLAGLLPTIDWSALPELLAFDFVGGDRTLLHGVRAVELATTVEVTRAGATERTYWPIDARWKAVDEDDAYEFTADALLRTLDVRTRTRPVTLLLTAGADSRVLAVALQALGRPFDATCWGADGWPDVDGARAVANHLGAPFTSALSWRADDEVVPEYAAEARWSDGMSPLGLPRRVWPEGTGCVLLGTAGEVGRAFYYREAAGRRPPPRGVDDAVAALDPAGRLGPASHDASALARDSARRWVHAAQESGHDGWRLLDVVYAEQRVRRWARGHVPALAPNFLAGFAPSEVALGLMSLPLAERRTDGFHRRFVAERAEGIALAEPPTPPPTGFVAKLARRAVRRLRPTTVDYVMAPRWAERPASRAWMTDHVLAHPSVAAVMGPRWAGALRAGFIGGSVQALAHATLVAGPVSLDDSLRGLRNGTPT